MKKIYLTLTTTLFVASLFAQAPLKAQKNAESGHVATNDKVITQTYKDLRGSSFKISNNRATTISENISAIDLVTDWWGTTSSQNLGFTNPIFPDSNAMIAYTSSTSPAWLHSVAQTFDLGGLYATDAGKVFDPMVQPFSGSTDFTIDSIFVQGYYNRLNMTVVDTAVITVYARDNGNYSRANWFSNPDSTKRVLDYSTKTALEADAPLGTYKIPMNTTFFNDTLPNGLHLFQVASNLTVGNTHNGIFGVSIHFLPGKTYSQATDTLFVNSNSIRVLYSTPLGASTSFPIGAGPDNNIGAFNDNNSLYGTWSYFLPPYVFTTDHTYQMYDMNVKISQSNFDNASINEFENGATLFQNYPNPSTGFTTVKYALENQANVSFEMIDVTGKKVISSVEGNRNAGTHTIEINTNDLNAGIYFYSLVVNGQTITKKMTITK
jgi:hypothetical protein